MGEESQHRLTCRGAFSFTRGLGIPKMALNNGSMFFAIASGSSPAMPWIADVYTICDGKDGSVEEGRMNTGKALQLKQRYTHFESQNRG